MHTEASEYFMGEVKNRLFFLLMLWRWRWISYSTLARLSALPSEILLQKQQQDVLAPSVSLQYLVAGPFECATRTEKTHSPFKA